VSFLWDLLPAIKRRLWEAAVGPRQRQQVPAAKPARNKTKPAHPASATADKSKTRPSSRGRRAKPAASIPNSPAAPVVAAPPRPSDSAQDRYDALVAHMLELHGVKVRKWRTSMSGVAWQLRYKDGSVKKLIEAPRPKGPMSAAVFLHEIGHHAIGFNTYKPRCLEEYHAWAWSLAAMEAHGVNVTDSVRLRMHRSLAYAVAKARRRGLARLPVELEPFAAPPPPSENRTRRRRHRTG
jgi:hypothetical protein